MPCVAEFRRQGAHSFYVSEVIGRDHSMACETKAYSGAQEIRSAHGRSPRTGHRAHLLSTGAQECFPCHSSFHVDSRQTDKIFRWEKHDLAETWSLSQNWIHPWRHTNTSWITRSAQHWPDSQHMETTAGGSRRDQSKGRTHSHCVREAQSLGRKSEQRSREDLKILGH